MSASVLNLPVAGTMVQVSTGFTPARLIGITIHPDNPLKFDFIVNSGDAQLAPDALKEESRKLIKYFLAALTTPEDELWVNLSPYEKDRMIPQGLGQTEMGRDMLAQDYLLKQLTASLMYPEKELGKKFWDKIYKRAKEEYGMAEIPINTFNKVWVVPQEAVVYEKDSSAFVVKSRLKVMLEKDYLAGSQGHQATKSPGGDLVAGDLVTPEIIREVILPEIEKEINEGKNFATLRQMYNSLILAAWYKIKLKDGLLAKVYVDKNKTKGIDTEDKDINRKIYDQYIESFQKGVYNYIKEDTDPATQDVIPRKYFSGGLGLGQKIIRMVGATLLVLGASGLLEAEFVRSVPQENNNSVEVILGENPKNPNVFETMELSPGTSEVNLSFQFAAINEALELLERSEDPAKVSSPLEFYSIAHAIHIIGYTGLGLSLGLGEWYRRKGEKTADLAQKADYYEKHNKVVPKMAPFFAGAGILGAGMVMATLGNVNLSQEWFVGLLTILGYEMPEGILNYTPYAKELMTASRQAQKGEITVDELSKIEERGKRDWGLKVDLYMWAAAFALGLSQIDIPFSLTDSFAQDSQWENLGLNLGYLSSVAGLTAAYYLIRNKSSNRDEGPSQQGPASSPVENDWSEEQIRSWGEQQWYENLKKLSAMTDNARQNDIMLLLFEILRRSSREVLNAAISASSKIIREFPEKQPGELELESEGLIYEIWDTANNHLIAQTKSPYEGSLENLSSVLENSMAKFNRLKEGKDELTVHEISDILEVLGSLKFEADRGTVSFGFLKDAVDALTETRKTALFEPMLGQVRVAINTTKTHESARESWDYTSQIIRTTIEFVSNLLFEQDAEEILTALNEILWEWPQYPETFGQLNEFYQRVSSFLEQNKLEQELSEQRHLLYLLQVQMNNFSRDIKFGSSPISSSAVDLKQELWDELKTQTVHTSIYTLLHTAKYGAVIDEEVKKQAQDLSNKLLGVQLSQIVRLYGDSRERAFDAYSLANAALYKQAAKETNIREEIVAKLSKDFDLPSLMDRVEQETTEEGLVMLQSEVGKLPDVTKRGRLERVIRERIKGIKGLELLRRIEMAKTQKELELLLEKTGESYRQSRGLIEADYSQARWRIEVRQRELEAYQIFERIVKIESIQKLINLKQALRSRKLLPKDHQEAVRRIDAKQTELASSSPVAMKLPVAGKPSLSIQFSVRKNSPKPAVNIRFNWDQDGAKPLQMWVENPSRLSIKEVARRVLAALQANQTGDLLSKSPEKYKNLPSEVAQLLEEKKTLINLAAKPANLVSSPVGIPQNAKVHFQFSSLNEEDQKMVEELFRKTKLVAKTLEHCCQEASLSVSDIDSMNVRLHSATGKNRITYKVDVFLYKNNQFLTAAFALKISRTKDRDALHQTILARITSEKLGGRSSFITKLSDGRYVTAGKFYDQDTLNEVDIKRNDIDLFYVAAVKTSVRIWKDLGGFFPLDPHDRQYIVAKYPVTQGDLPEMLLVDRGNFRLKGKTIDFTESINADGELEIAANEINLSDLSQWVEPTSEAKLIENLIYDLSQPVSTRHIGITDPDDEMLKAVNDLRRPELSEEMILDGVEQALGAKEAIKFWKNFLADPKRNSITSIRQLEERIVKKFPDLASSPVINRAQGLDNTVQLTNDDGRTTTNEVGGIDLNPALLDLQIKRDGNGVPLPLPQQPIETMHIDGFVPIIINVTPIPSLPVFLGLNTEGEEEPLYSTDASPQLAPLGYREEDASDNALAYSEQISHN